MPLHLVDGGRAVMLDGAPLLGIVSVIGKRSDADRFLTGTEHSKPVGASVDPAAGRVTLAHAMPSVPAVEN